jgi:hypothetical protein
MYKAKGWIKLLNCEKANELVPCVPLLLFCVFHASCSYL